MTMRSQFYESRGFTYVALTVVECGDVPRSQHCCGDGVCNGAEDICGDNGRCRRYGFRRGTCRCRDAGSAHGHHHLPRRPVR